jgi:hypothetical protein
MARFRKRPVEVDAVQFTEAASSLGECLAFGEGYVRDVMTSRGSPPVLSVTTLHGDVFAYHGAWIVRGGPGDYWPVKPDVFAASYEPAERTCEKHGVTFDGATEGCRPCARASRTEGGRP